ncbi:MAG: FAD-binding oxidoreductase [Acidimicrobiia bacterium]|nr:FAD-binding oxidoreductase [Acidimicrobiia bacterium]
MSPNIVVVGAGLVGSALSRRLAEAGLQPVCFGPSSGPPYSSHDDSGRITRILDASPTWAMLAARAIADYSDIEARSAIQFHHPVGVLWSARSPGPLVELDSLSSTLGVERGTGLGGWEGIAAVGGDETLLERGPAGYISPRDMLRAHRVLAERGGAVFDDRVVQAVESIGGRWAVRLRDGESVTADRIVVAAGAGSRELVDVGLEVTGEVVIDAPLPAGIGAALAGLPCIGRLTSDSVVEGYLTPPIRAADGWSLKFGAELPAATRLGNGVDVAEWMGGDAHAERLPAMVAALRGLFPGLGFGHARSRPCIYARTRTGFPIVDELEPGLFVVTGGNGRMAKSADAVAALASMLVIDDGWGDSEFDHSHFAV